ncbi:MAG: hypothetical protein H3C47_02855 [Candidatus Cloacimonetes bacterium]|nr:hypothetical protein [Candidatus Cloacimonadota bacterium]
MQFRFVLRWVRSVFYFMCFISVVNSIKAVKQSTPSQERVILKQSPFQPHAMLYHEIQPLPVWFESSPLKEARKSVFHNSNLRFVQDETVQAECHRVISIRCHPRKYHEKSRYRRR